MKNIIKTVWNLFLNNCKPKGSMQTIYPINWKSVSALANSNPDSIRALISRMIRLEPDTTLTYKERGIAYAGQTFLPEHKGLSEELFCIRNLMNNGRFDEAKTKNVDVLKRCPLNLLAVVNMVDIINYELRNSTKVSEFTETDLKYYTCLGRCLLDTIASTGYGTAKYPFDVVFVHDEYLFMEYYLGIKSGTQALVDYGKVAKDRFTVVVKSEKYDKDDIFFDITRVLELEARKYL